MTRIALWAVLLTFGFILISAGPARSQSAGADLFHQGRYGEAYAALWPLVNAGDPEALFYALLIRRNGLDGRAPADPGELATLWNLLSGQAERMRAGAADRSLPDRVRQAYRTALAQLEYFGPYLNAWPPPYEAERPKRVRRATAHLGSAARNFTPAMNFLAFLDIEAYGGRHLAAFNRTLRAAEKGDRLAMGNLAWFYREGVGTDKNDLRAAHWAHRATQSSPGLSRAQNEMGYLYESGRGVSLDLKEAARWYALSAAQGHPAGLANNERLKKGSPAPPALDNRVCF